MSGRADTEAPNPRGHPERQGSEKLLYVLECVDGVVCPGLDTHSQKALGDPRLA